MEKDYITLGQFLKMTDTIATGGEAKFFLNNNDVKVNGEAENRRGRKLYQGDTVDINDRSFVIK